MANPMRIWSTFLMSLLALSMWALPIPPAVATTIHTTRVSISSAGVQGDNGASDLSSVSADGRYVAFASYSTNLVSGDTNGFEDVFVRDLMLDTTIRVSVSSAGVQGDEDSFEPSISDGGRYVAFASFSDNLVPGDTNGSTDVFVRDLALGTTTRVSVTSAGVQGNGRSGEPSISFDGRYVAFDSNASNLVPGDTNRYSDVFVRDRQLHKTFRSSISTGGTQGNLLSFEPSITDDGRFVAFDSDASNLVPGDTNRYSDVFVRDRKLHKTFRSSVSSARVQGNGNSIFPSISDDGRFVAFYSDAYSLVPHDTNGSYDVFVRDRHLHRTSRSSVSSAGVQGDGGSVEPSISDDGRYVAFASGADNLVLGDTNGFWDVFVRDRALHTTALISVSTAGVQGNSFSVFSSISGDGQEVAFTSDANNLVFGDTNGNTDVFERG